MKKRTRFALRRQRPAFRILILLFALFFLITAYSLGRAVFATSSDPLAARVAEWSRDHYLGFVVTGLEQIQYQLHPPKVGGSVTPGILKTGPSSRIQLETIVTPALPGEGTYSAVLKNGEVPIIETAYMRPDAIHTSYLSTIVRMSGALTRFEQRPGYSDPGLVTGWTTSDSILDLASSGIIATFNGGFKIKSAKGGIYQDGVTKGKLLAGAATLVVYKDGHSEIGSWGRDFTMSPEISSARQNLKLLINEGAIATNINDAVQSNWGTTVGIKTFVWRSGIGITKNGDFVYVVGNALSAYSLANLLLKAGAIRAMQLDINAAWVSYMYYKPTVTGLLHSIKVAPFDRPANRYFKSSSRDFFVVYSK